MGGRRDELGTNWASKKVRVLVDGVLESLIAMIREDLEINISRLSVVAKVELLKVLELHLVVVSKQIQVTTGSASIAFVNIVRAI